MQVICSSFHFPDLSWVKTEVDSSGAAGGTTVQSWRVSHSTFVALGKASAGHATEPVSWLGPHCYGPPAILRLYMAVSCCVALRQQYAVTWRGKWKPLIATALVEMWGTLDMAVYQNSGYFLRLNQRVIICIISGCVGMWHALIPCVDPPHGVSLILRGREHWGAPTARGLARSMHPAGIYLEWEGGLHGGLLGGDGDAGRARGSDP